MAAGTYTSKKRVVKSGFLVAFKGETMSMDEAIKRGLVKADDGAAASAKEEKNPPKTDDGKSGSGGKQAPLKPDITKTKAPVDGIDDPDDADPDKADDGAAASAKED